MKCYFVLLFFCSFFIYAEKLPGGLESNNAYINDQAKSVNSFNIQGAEVIKKALKGETYKIPKDWRLVSVQKDNTRSSENEYILFFQDAKANVHTLSVGLNGMISGSSTMSLLSN
jgi:hypothetical protein